MPESQQRIKTSFNVVDVDGWHYTLSSDAVYAHFWILILKKRVTSFVIQTISKIRLIDYEVFLMITLLISYF